MTKAADVSPVHKALAKGTITYRWLLFKEIAEMPASGSLSELKQNFEETSIKAIRNSIPLLEQWGFLGWQKSYNTSGKIDYKKTFDKNNGKRDLLSPTGLRFAKIIELIEYSKTSNKFTGIYEECVQAVRKIRMLIYKNRWENHGLEVLSGQEMTVDYIEVNAIRSDIFRLLCFDSLVRNKSLTMDQIYLISSVVDDPSRHGVKDLMTFRTWIDERSNEIETGRYIVVDPDRANWEIGTKYHLLEFQEYKQVINGKKETKGIQMFSTVEGDSKVGFQYLGAEDCFTELQGKLEELI